MSGNLIWLLNLDMVISIKEGMDPITCHSNRRVKNPMIPARSNRRWSWKTLDKVPSFHTETKTTNPGSEGILMIKWIIVKILSKQKGFISKSDNNGLCDTPRWQVLTGNSHFILWGLELGLWINYGNFEVSVQEEDCVYE